MTSEHLERYGESVLSPEWHAEKERLDAIAASTDSNTFHLLEDLGISPDWRCLEVGAGTGSVAAWMARRGADVVATDIDIRFMEGLADLGPRVMRHDVIADPMPEAPFDLIHARFVLEHLPARERVLDRMVSWLAPGGTLLIEGMVTFGVDRSPHPAFREAVRVIMEMLKVMIGTDTAWTESMPEPLLKRGITDLGASVHIPISGGGGPAAECLKLTLAQLRPLIVEHMPDSLAAIDECLAYLENPYFYDYAFGTLSAWGRLPA